jgi:predicted transcriptional regulator
MSNSNSQKIKKDIVKVLEKHPEGLTIQDLSKLIGAHRHTITKYVLVLEAVDIIYRRRVGSATLHYLKNLKLCYLKQSSKVNK